MGVNAGAISIMVRSFPIFDPIEFHLKKNIDKRTVNLFEVMLFKNCLIYQRF